MPATSQEPSGRLPRPGRVRKRRLRSTKRVSARHQVKRPERYSLSRTRSGRRIRSCYWRSSFGADPCIRSLTGQGQGLRFGPDVFADALVPRRRSRPHCFSHRYSEWPSGVAALLRRLPRAAQIALLAPMVIVSPNRTVNRIPQIARQSSKTADFSVL